jgi:hypothetical protein
MKKLKLNEPMAKEFFSGVFGGIYNRKTIECCLTVMNKGKAAEMKFESGFFDKNIMEYDDNDVEVTITCTLRKIGEN